jgi:hypothetical protein
VTATVLNLFVMPSLYLRFGRSKRQRRAVEIPALRGEPQAVTVSA